MKPAFRLALLIPALSLSFIHTAFADDKISGYKEELEDGSEVLKFNTGKKVFTFKVSESGEFELDRELLAGILDTKTGDYIEPLLPALPDDPNQGPEAFLSPSLYQPDCYGTPKQTDDYVTVRIRPGTPLPPASSENTGEQVKMPVVKQAVTVQGESAVALRNTDNQQSPVRKPIEFTEKEWNLFVEGQRAVEKTKHLRKLGLSYKRYNNLAGTHNTEGLGYTHYNQPESSLQERYPDQQFENCQSFTEGEVAQLENKIQKEREAKGVSGTELVKFEMDIKVIHDQALAQINGVNPKKISDELSGVIRKYLQLSEEQKVSFASLLTYANQKDMGVVIYHPKTDIDVKRYAGMTLLDARMPTGQAVTDATVRLFAQVAIKKIKEENKKLTELAMGSVKGFMSVAEALLPDSVPYAGYKTNLEKLAESDSGIEHVLEGLMVFLMYKEMGYSLSSMQIIYAENQHGNLWWMIEAFNKIYDLEPAHFVLAYNAKALLGIPVMGKMPKLFVKFKKP
ncbi:hypothetical protein NX722_18915 [Endozoicomonas gorgoniicola]|uniref:Uncharacterized protein n=1 Tax=Endozoicomonas gorgoniicola TaxID=1234144 RepID=A0ABT3MZW4_9GAMM|nr:hypothetical protein [Endozoicomonas gorgoniicola]MCW7554653.1 hypothetical protein [Endozoicomonas gorgoniicola]